MAGAVAVRGLSDLTRDLKRMAATDLSTDLRDELRKVAEPIAYRAEQLAVSEISHMGTSSWRKMRIGVTSKVVYIAPRQHGKKVGAQKRPAFGLYLYEQAMEPALDEFAPLLNARVEKAIDNFALVNGF
jgi:hypothetical protein